MTIVGSPILSNLAIFTSGNALLPHLSNQGAITSNLVSGIPQQVSDVSEALRTYALSMTNYRACAAEPGGKSDGIV